MAKEKEKVEVQKPKKAMLFSRLNHVVEVEYNGEVCMVSPNAKIKIEDVSKLNKEKLPKGLIIRNID